MSIWNQFETTANEFNRNIRNLPILPQVTPAQVRGELARYSFEQPVAPDQIFEDVRHWLREWTCHVTHPRYFGLYNPSVRPIGIVADALTALYNPQLAAWSHAPAANEIEQWVLRYFMRAIGWVNNAAIANFTSGGAEANMSAVLAALAYRCADWSTRGLAALPAQPVIYLTGESHHSFVKVARMCGLGTDSLSHVPTDDTHVMDLAVLESLIERDKRAGRWPLMIIGTAGTTGAGLVDRLPRLAEIASRHDIWFHCDAAWGGSALLSPNLRTIVRGIEQADSVTWDAHKWLSVPMGAGMFFCRHPDAVRSAFAVSTSYMPVKSNDDIDDPYVTTAQWSRRMIGLKMFMSLAELGADGYARQIENQAALGNLIRERLRATDWRIDNDTLLPVVCFSDDRLSIADDWAMKMLTIVYRRNRVWISQVKLGKKQVLRACVTSYHTNAEDIECLIDELEVARRQA